MIGLVRLGAEAWALRPWRLPRPETDTTEAPFARPRKRTSGPEPRVRTQTSWPGARPATCQQRRGRRGAGRGGPGEGPRAGAYSPASAHIGLDGFVRCATTGPVFPKGPTREALPRVEPGGKFAPRGDPWGVQVRFVTWTRLPLWGCSSTLAPGPPRRSLDHAPLRGPEGGNSLARAGRRAQRRPQRLARRRAEMAAGFQPSSCRAVGNSRSRRRWEVPSAKVGPFPIGRGSPPSPLPARPRRA